MEDSSFTATEKSTSKVKIMSVILFNSTGIVHHEFTSTGQTINQDYYRCVFKRLCEKVRKKRPALRKDRS